MAEKLMARLESVAEANTRIGLPDSSVMVELVDPSAFISALDGAVRALRQVFPAAATIVDVQVNTVRRTLWIRVAQRSEFSIGTGIVDPPLAAPLAALRATTESNGGMVEYWGGTNFFDVHLPDRSSRRGRVDFPQVDHLPWEARYRRLLTRATWSSLRDMVYRNGALAVEVAARCVDHGMRTVLIPSVGISIHPWLFASYGPTVIATDAAKTALETVSRPSKRPKLYAYSAYERWDIAMAASYGTAPHPEAFHGMPRLEDPAVLVELRGRIHFLLSDWASLPLPDGSVDLVFAVNAIPRDSASLRRSVVEEWLRVTRSGGAVFVAQHHAPADWDPKAVFFENDCREIAFLAGCRPPGGVRGFELRLSSG